MPINRPEKSDAVIESIITGLERYAYDHPEAVIDLYRYNPAAIRVRIIDPVFQGKPRHVRHQYVWKYLEQLSDDDVGDISLFVLITPEEQPRSPGNLEFEYPSSILEDDGVSDTANVGDRVG